MKRSLLGALLAVVGLLATWLLYAPARGSEPVVVAPVEVTKPSVEKERRYELDRETDTRKALVSLRQDESIARGARAGGEHLSLIQACFIDADRRPLAGVLLHRVGRRKAIARSDAGGRVSILVELDPGLERLEFEARLLGFAVERREILRDGDRPFWIGDWILTPGRKVAGSVVDANGVPVADARVAVLEDRSRLTPRENPKGALELPWKLRRCDGFERLRAAGGQVVETDEHGGFVLAAPARGLRLVAGRGGACGRSARLEVGPEPVSGVLLRLEVCPSSELRGIVLDPTGIPVPYARVRIQTPTRFQDFCADEEGAFTFPLNGEEEREVEVRACDPLGRYRETRRVGRLSPEYLLELLLTEARWFEIHVRDASGAAIEQFGFELVDRNDVRLGANPGFPAVAHAPDGVARVALPWGEFFIHVHGGGYRPYRSGPLQAELLGESIMCRLELGGALVGTLRFTGLPVAGAKVALFPVLERPTLMNGFPLIRQIDPDSSAITDERGRFALGVRHAGSFHVVAESGGLPPLEVGPIWLGIDTHLEKDLELLQGGALKVIVVPVDPAADPTGKIVGLANGNGDVRTRRCGPEGFVLFEGLAPGPWLAALCQREIQPGVRHTQGDPGGVPEARKNALVHPGELTELVLDGAEETQRANTLTGRFSVNGSPAQGWTAYLKDEQGRLSAPVPLAAGVFRLGSDSTGPHELVLRDSRGRLWLEPIEMVAGNRTWARQLELSVWKVPELPSEREGTLVFHEWRAGTARFLTLLSPGSDGSLLEVPQGPGRILRYASKRALENQVSEVMARVSVGD